MSNFTRLFWEEFSNLNTTFLEKFMGFCKIFTPGCLELESAKKEDIIGTETVLAIQAGPDWKRMVSMVGYLD